MSMKPAACLAFVLNTLLFGTYYAVAKNALGHIDPVMFSYFEMMTLAPAGLCILFVCWRRVTRAVVRRGITLGSSLCLALFTISIALKYTSATSTAFFPSLNGFLAALIAWLVLRQPVTKATWFAGLLSVVGTTMLILNSSVDGLRGVLIAFLGGVFFTVYVFLSDSMSETDGEELAPLPLFGVELLTMAVWANLVVLLFGDWRLHLVLPQDGETVVYVAFACTFLPTLIATFMQRHISAVTVSFIYILEPVFGAIIAYLYLHETLPLYGYIGGALVVCGALVHTWGMTRKPYTIQVAEHVTYAEEVRPAREAYRPSHSYSHTWASLSRTARLHVLSVLLYPVWLIMLSFALFTMLDGMPPVAWRVFASIVSQNTLQNYFGFWPLTLDRGMVLIQALCWLVAWSALILAISIAVRYAYRTVVRKHETVKASLPVRKQVLAAVGTIEMPVSYHGETPKMHPRITGRSVGSRRDDIEEYDTLPVTKLRAGQQRQRTRHMREYRQPVAHNEFVARDARGA